MRTFALLGALLGPLMALLSAAPALAFIPEARRVERAVAETNVASGRTQALRFELLMRIDDGEPVARGELVTHPTGLARLELRGAGDLLERHLLQGTDHTASRNGSRLSEPRALLPPMFFMQAGSTLTLRTALEAFGSEADAIGLAPCGESDCFVVGDPTRAPPQLPIEEGDLEDNPGRRRSDPVLRVAPSRDAPLRAQAVWFDTSTYDLVGIDNADGTRVRFGPPAVFEGLRVPSWVRIEEPGFRPVRFDVKRAAPVNAPAAAFSRSWLYATSDSEPEESPASSEPERQPDPYP